MTARSIEPAPGAGTAHTRRQTRVVAGDDGRDLRCCPHVWPLTDTAGLHRRHTAHRCIWDGRHGGACLCRCGATTTREDPT